MAFYQCWGQKVKRERDTTERGVETPAGVLHHPFGMDVLLLGIHRETPPQGVVGWGLPTGLPGPRQPPTNYLAWKAEEWELGGTDLSTPTYLIREISAISPPSSPFLPGSQGDKNSNLLFRVSGSVQKSLQIVLLHLD